MLKVEHLTKTFGDGSGKVTAVKDVSFEVPEGSYAAVVGKSGSGKSTMLALLGALDVPTSGTIVVNGQKMSELFGSALNRYRRSTIGFVFQSYNLIPNLTALENVMLPMEFAGVGGSEKRKRAEHLLAQVGLSDGQVTRRPGKLSGGEQQRVAIARALANKPKLILADEPTGNLDSQTGASIIDLLRSLARSEKTTVMIVTHDTAIAEHADHVYRLQDGALIEGRSTK